MIRTSDTVTAISAAWVTAAAAMPTVPKRTKGQVGNATRFYADLPTIVETIQPVLAEHGLAFIQGVSDGDKVVTITTRLIHKSGEWIEDSLTMPTGQNNAQAVGSAITYGKRYSLSALLGLATDDDDGAAASKPAPRQAAPKVEAPAPSAAPAPVGEKASDAQITKIAILLNERDGKDRDAKLARLSLICGRSIASSKDLTKHEASTVIEELTR